eukprot:GFYU01006132.1.p1 GENE.GFYU01006132.1~~GFYU01006132.1.p1  ORF type:complete len:364 (-),score=38.99 GFYU01006132.1:4-1095(-)
MALIPACTVYDHNIDKFIESMELYQKTREWIMQSTNGTALSYLDQGLDSDAANKGGSDPASVRASLYYAIRDIVEPYLDSVLSSAIANRQHIVWETTGNGVGWVHRVVENAHKNGYDVTVVYPLVDLDNLEARATSRASGGGQTAVSREYIQTVGGNALLNLGYMVDLCDRVVVYNNDGDVEERHLVFSVQKISIGYKAADSPKGDGEYFSGQVPSTAEFYGGVLEAAQEPGVMTRFRLHEKYRSDRSTLEGIRHKFFGQESNTQIGALPSGTLILTIVKKINAVIDKHTRLNHKCILMGTPSDRCRHSTLLPLLAQTCRRRGDNGAFYSAWDVIGVAQAGRTSRLCDGVHGLTISTDSKERL